MRMRGGTAAWNEKKTPATDITGGLHGTATNDNIRTVAIIATGTYIGSRGGMLKLAGGMALIAINLRFSPGRVIFRSNRAGISTGIILTEVVGSNRNPHKQQTPR